MLFFLSILILSLSLLLCSDSSQALGSHPLNSSHGATAAVFTPRSRLTHVVFDESPWLILFSCFMKKLIWSYLVTVYFLMSQGCMSDDLGWKIFFTICNQTWPNIRHKMRLAGVWKKAFRTYGRPDGRPDGWTDTTSYRDARTHLKKLGFPKSMNGFNKTWDWRRKRRRIRRRRKRGRR